MRKKKHSRWLGLILCASMMLNLFPTTAFANDMGMQISASETSTEADSEEIPEMKTEVESEGATDDTQDQNEANSDTPQSGSTETESPDGQETVQNGLDGQPVVQKAYEVAIVKLADTDGSVWGKGIITGSENLDDTSWNKDTDENRGYDGSSANDIIRSFDSINYNVVATIKMADGESHILTYEVTLPDDDELALDEGAMNAIEPIECRKNGDGTKTYVCRYTLQSNYSGGEKEEHVIVKIGNKHQGYQITPVIKAYLDTDTEAAKTVENMETVTVTSAPMYNIVLKKLNNETIAKDVYDFNKTSENGKIYYPDHANGYTDKKVTGYKCTYGFALEIRKPGEGIKGAELPDPTKDFTFDIDLSSAVLNGKNLAENGFLPLLYYLGPNEAGGGAVTEIPFTKEYTGNEDLSNKGCLNSGNVTMTQEGTMLHVTVKDFQIDVTKFPKENYSGTSYWEDLNKIREGIFSAFQFQIVYPYINENGENLLTKLGGGTVNVAAEVKNMQAVSETGFGSGEETSGNDNQQTNTWSLASGHSRNQQIFYSDRNNVIGPYTIGKIWNDGDIAPVGADQLAFTVSYLEEHVGEADEKEMLPVAIDQLVLFDRNAIEDVEYNKYIQSGINNPRDYGYECHVLYAVRKEGRLDNESMRTAKIEDFEFYDKRPEGGCDGVLVQYRGMNLSSSSLRLHAQFYAKVKADAEIADKVYMITAFTNTWTAADYQEKILADTGKESLNDLTRADLGEWGKANANTIGFVKDGISLVMNKKPIQPVVDYRGDYTVPRYEEGVYIADPDHKGNIYTADGLYIVPYTTTVTKTVAQTDENGNPRNRYNIGKNQRYVDYKISSSMRFWSDVNPVEDSKTTIYFEDTIPEGLSYISNSAYWGGTYISKYPDAGKVEGGTQIEPTITQENGKTVLRWAIPEVAQKKGELPTLYYSCRISNSVKDNENLENAVTIQTTEDKRPAYAELDNISTAAVSVTRDKEFYIVKRGGDSLELQDQSYYELVVSNTSSEDKKDLCVFDTMPYDGDGKSKQFNGKYAITALTMDAADVKHASDMEVWYTNSETYIGKTADDIASSEVTEANGWKKAEASGYEGDTIKFTGDGLIDGWPTVIAYKDANLESNTIATLRLEYKAEAGAEEDYFTNTWSTLSNGKEINSSVDTDVYNRTLEGTVWFDKNKDGKIDEDETKLEGVRVTLLVKDKNGNYVPYESYNQTVNGENVKCPSSVETDKDGHYKFTGLPQGEYRVKFESGDGTDLGYYDVTEPNADKDVTKTSKVEKENAVKDENGELSSGTITDITMPTLETMVTDNKGENPKGSTYDLPDQNLGLTIPDTAVSVEKIWDDANDQDGKRPDKVEITLVADGKATDKKLELSEENNWIGEFENLPKYDDEKFEDGRMHTIQYTVKEKVVEGYTAEVAGDAANVYTVTNKHTPETTEVAGSKTWDDADNQDGKRPESITVRLLANGKEVAVKEVTESDNWSWNFTDLPKYEAGKELIYTVTEDAVKDYVTSVDGYNVTNSYEPGKVSVPVSKVWEDGNNQDGIRPEKITVKLLANGKETGKELELTEETNWSGVFKDLDEKAAGKKIEYTVKEDKVDGYTSEITGDAGKGYVVTNTHEPEKTEVAGSKTWNDADNQDGKRPESITIRLFANGTEVAKKEVKADDSWSWNFTDLPKYENGVEIIYTITEDSVKDYITTVDGYNVTNTHKPGKVSVPVTKAWNDGNNQDGIRPETIKVHLYADGKDTGKELELTKENNWGGIFTDLDEKAAGKKIEYTVKEDKVDGYTSEITGDAWKGYVVTNTHEPEKTEIAGNKTWDDVDNQDGKRPESITIRLLANGTEVAKKEVKADDNWSWNFTDLPKYEAGTEIIYTVTEDAVKDYVTSVDRYNVTNSYKPGKVSVPVTKAWEDGNNQDGIRPEKITVKLLANGKETGKELELTEETNWSGTFTDLDEYQSGKKIEYSVKEEKVKGYTTEVTGDAATGYIVTNKHTPEITEIAGSKTWDDADNQDGDRPESITIRLLANGTELAKKEVKAGDNWNWNFTDLPKYENGVEIIYTITEDSVKDYTTTVNGYNVTNTHKPGKVSVPVTKAWNDGNNQDGIRPEAIIVHLYADEKDTGKELELTKENNWSGIFTDLDEKAAGKKIEYTVKEDKVDGYTSEITGDAGKGYVVTNTHEPEKTEVAGNKTWDDADNQDGKRPESITVRLLANGKEVAVKEVTESDNWSWNFTDLPKYEAGTEIVYTVTEDAVKDYVTSVDGYNVTNSYKPGKVSISVTKSWDDIENKDGIRPDSIKVHLYANGEDTGKELELTEKTNWSGSFTDLDEYKDGEKITYTVTEEEVKGYTFVITGDMNQGYIITNTHTPKPENPKSDTPKNDKPDKPAKPSGKDSQQEKESVKTGDTSGVMSWMVICIISFVISTAVAVKSRRRETEN